mmetsp:Transcript_20262/g.70151  ORF Transcript_20262/g.70151 Transcript_20262/m.70151 type:complete len:451 (-) Transcript_20262:1537-2889(-)
MPRGCLRLELKQRCKHQSAANRRRKSVQRACPHNEHSVVLATRVPRTDVQGQEPNKRPGNAKLVFIDPMIAAHHILAHENSTQRWSCNQILREKPTKRLRRHRTNRRPGQTKIGKIQNQDGFRGQHAHRSTDPNRRHTQQDLRPPSLRLIVQKISKSETKIMIQKPGHSKRYIRFGPLDPPCRGLCLFLERQFLPVWCLHQIPLPVVLHARTALFRHVPPADVKQRKVQVGAPNPLEHGDQEEAKIRRHHQHCQPRYPVFHGHRARPQTVEPIELQGVKSDSLPRRERLRPDMLHAIELRARSDRLRKQVSDIVLCSREGDAEVFHLHIQHPYAPDFHVEQIQLVAEAYHPPRELQVGDRTHLDARGMKGGRPQVERHNVTVGTKGAELLPIRYRLPSPVSLRQHVLEWGEVFCSPERDLVKVNIIRLARDQGLLCHPICKFVCQSPILF